MYHLILGLGIGKIIAKELAQRGGTVHLVCRNADRGKTAADEIKEETKNDVTIIIIAVFINNNNYCYY